MASTEYIIKHNRFLFAHDSRSLSDHDRLVPRFVPCFREVRAGNRAVEVCSVSHGPLPYQAIDEAIAIGQLRGRVQMNGTLHERLYDLTLATTVPFALVSVKTAPRILAPAREIAAEFNEDILRFRTMIRDTAVSCELWLRSRHGTWRFFRIARDRIIELSRDGTPLT